jgi:hypothetical protein
MPAIVIVIALLTGIVVLYDSRHNPGGILAEVYDDTQPASGLDVLTVEALTTRNRVHGPVVGTRYGSKDHVNVIQKPGTPTGQMESRASVKDDAASIGVRRFRKLCSHALDGRQSCGCFSRVSER